MIQKGSEMNCYKVTVMCEEFSNPESVVMNNLVAPGKEEARYLGESLAKYFFGPRPDVSVEVEYVGEYEG